MSGSTNGRIYDPHIARFVQADPFVQAPGDLQMLNRYSYVRNNPLNATDPSGFISIGDIFKIAVVVVASVFTYGAAFGAIANAFAVTTATGVSISAGAITAAAIGAGAAAGFVGGALSTAFAGGSIQDILRGGLYGAISGAAFGAIGAGFRGEGFFAQGGLGHIGTHALTGGVLNDLQGGKFGHGFISAGIVKGLAPAIGKVNGWIIAGRSVAQAMAAAIVGGTVSQLTGGKFQNGAVTGAFQNLFNQQSQPDNLKSRAEKQLEGLLREVPEYRVMSKEILKLLQQNPVFADHVDQFLERNGEIRSDALNIRMSTIDSVGVGKSGKGVVVGALVDELNAKVYERYFLRRSFNAFRNNIKALEQSLTRELETTRERFQPVTN